MISETRKLSIFQLRHRQGQRVTRPAVSLRGGSKTGPGRRWKSSLHDVLFSGARVRRLATHPTEQSWVVSAVQGNNEVTVWDLETGARRQALWASHTPPLSQTQVCYRKLLLIRSGLLQLTEELITGLEKVLRNNLLRLWAPAAGAHKRSEQLPY